MLINLIFGFARVDQGRWWVVVAHGRSRNAGGGHSCYRIRAIYEEISVIMSFLCYHGSK